MNSLSSTLLCITAILVTVASSTAARAQTERIHSYHSDITVEEDSSLRVVETIRVTAAGRDIKRGIYRDFPTLYRSRYLMRIEVPFDVVSVLRNGKPEPYRIEEQRNGVRVRIGQENVTLPRGQHEYQLTYTTRFQLGFFEQHDELYWNVTGTGWDFPIDQVTASVHLPPDVPLEEVTHQGYTGPEGSTARALTSRVDQESNTVEFATTTALGPGEGLTIVVGFPKGYVRQPTTEELQSLYLRANTTLWIVLLGLFVVAGYYLAAWWAVGRDPPGKPIYPRFDPPLDLPPACVRYLRQMGYDNKCFTAAILSMAVKGHLTIHEEDGDYTLRRVEDPPSVPLSPGETAVAKVLLRAKETPLEQSNHKKISKAIDKLGSRLSLEYDGKLFFKNRWWLVPGWLLSAAALAAAALSCGWTALPLVGFLTFWLSFWTIGCFALGAAVVAKWYSVVTLRRSTAKRLGSLLAAIGITALATPFFVAEVVAMGVLVHHTSLWILPLIVGLIAINWAYWHWIKQPTVEGRRVMDEIEGFRMYLSTAEQELLARLHPPEKTPELFEQYLPYALALDVENEWSEQFTDVLSEAAVAPSDNGYRPHWYHGRGWTGATTGAFATGLASALGSAIASSSTAPGSSSGGGGGGFSGGGGGGGGGGGW